MKSSIRRKRATVTMKALESYERWKWRNFPLELCWWSLAEAYLTGYRNGRRAR